MVDFTDVQEPSILIEQMRSDPLLTDVALVVSTGPVELPSVPAFWLVSFTNVRGDIGR